MKKSEIKTLSNNELIVEYVSTYSFYDTNFLLGRGTKQLEKHLKDLEEELVKRDILTESDIEELHK